MWFRDLLRRGVTRTPEAVALVDARRELTWSQLAEELARFAAHVSNIAARGDRVVLMAENRVETLAAYLGCGLCGAVVVPVGPLLADPEVRYILEQTQPVMAIGDAASLARVERLMPGLHRLDVGRMRHLDAEPMSTPVGGALEDPFAILHTSATTGQPKGVLLDVRSVQTSSLGWLAVLRPRPGLVYLQTTPLFHASMVSALGYLAGGATVAILDRFTPQGFLAAVERWRAEQTLLVPSMMRLLLQTRRLEDADLSSLTLMIHAGEAMAPELSGAISRRLGIPLRNSYGISEGGGNAITCGPEDTPSEAMVAGATCIGVPVPGYSAEVFRSDGMVAAEGEVGELCLAGDALMRGYWRDDEATARALREGWLRTGDLGYRDARGYFWAVNRRSDLILRAGQNVYPAEVERVIRQCRWVADVAVVAVPSAAWGQTPWAFVQPVSEEDFDEQELVSVVLRDLASYKRPSRFIRVDEVPRGPSGKLLRRNLRDRAAALKQPEGRRGEIAH